MNDWQKWFHDQKHGSCVAEPSKMEELRYQAFKARLLDEVVARRSEPMGEGVYQEILSDLVEKG